MKKRWKQPRSEIKQTNNALQGLTLLRIPTSFQNINNLLSIFLLFFRGLLICFACVARVQRDKANSCRADVARRVALQPEVEQGKFSDRKAFLRQRASGYCWTRANDNFATGKIRKLSCIGIYQSLSSRLSVSSQPRFYWTNFSERAENCHQYHHKL